ncbi:MAG: tetratricopeptide repeat protein, partial [Candidatus Heimdallarchaeota archaeon]|nr:tetratricopeptide repeat protein [Candidatus Heimdallarchaeota archaeon]
ILRQFGESELVGDAINGIFYCYRQMGKPDEALKSVEDFLARFPDNKYNVELQKKKSDFHFGQRAFESAIREYQNLITQYPKHELVPDAYYWIGRSQEELDSKDKAIRSYTHLAERYSRHSLAPESLFRIGKIYSSINDYNAALLTFGNLKKRYPKSETIIEARYEEGIVYRNMGDNEKAKESFGEIISDNGQTIIGDKSRNALGVIYAAEQNIREALRLFDEVVKRRVDELAAEAQFHIGEIRKAQGNLEEAYQEFLKVKYIYPAYDNWVTDALLNAGDCLEKMDKIKDAVKIYKDILKKHKGDEIETIVNERMKNLKK